MTNIEIKKLIKESPQSDEYNTKEFIFDFPYINYTKAITGLYATYVFVNQQLKGWESFEDELPTQLNNSINYFTAVKNSITNYLNSYAHQDLGNINNYISSVIQAIQSTRIQPFVYTIPEVNFLIKVHKDFPKSVGSCHSVITGNVNSTLMSSRDGFIGMMMAYEFIQKDNSQIVERRTAEKKSLSSLKRDFIDYISTVENETNKQIEESADKYNQQVESIEIIKEERANTIDTWFNSSKSDFEIFFSDSNENISALENTYEELMRLKKPADYWKERASELKKEGDKFFYILLSMVGFAVTTLYFLLWITPEGMQQTFFDKDKSVAIRWSIIYITFISFLFFAIKAVMKSMFSSYHLSRDAEERQRLTYVYLAMVKDSSIEKEDRHLVMQSLFSRADTGLLKEDSSPSMPGTGGIIDIIKK